MLHEVHTLRPEVHYFMQVEMALDYKHVYNFEIRYVTIFPKFFLALGSHLTDGKRKHKMFVIDRYLPPP